MKLKDVDSHRSLEIDGRNEACADSVFVLGGRGFCIEVDKVAFLDGIMREFDLVPAQAAA